MLTAFLPFNPLRFIGWIPKNGVIFILSVEILRALPLFFDSDFRFGYVEYMHECFIGVSACAVRTLFQFLDGMFEALHFDVRH